jgi:UDP-glucuronate 4-epimerase
MQVLVTGVAGFIGFHLASQLIKNGIKVYGIDNLNDFYSVSLKKDRLAQLEKNDGFTFELMDICDKNAMTSLFTSHSFESVVNLAAQAGVRYSIQKPHAYVDSNITGFLNILECCRHYPVKHLVFASSSSVYGMNTEVPFSTNHAVDKPISIYAVSKITNELMAHTYSHLFNIPITGLRFFTVYGPWGRPDMAYFKFVKNIEDGEPIDVYNCGDMMQRDFTYIDDIVEGIIRVLRNSPVLLNSQEGKPPFKLYNIGNHQPVSLIRFIEVIEEALGQVAKKNLMPMQQGDVNVTCADVTDLMKDVGFRPDTPIEVGIGKFVEWYRNYYGCTPPSK